MFYYIFGIYEATFIIFDFLEPESLIYPLATYAKRDFLGCTFNGFWVLTRNDLYSLPSIFESEIFGLILGESLIADSVSRDFRVLPFFAPPGDPIPISFRDECWICIN